MDVIVSAWFVTRVLGRCRRYKPESCLGKGDVRVIYRTLILARSTASRVNTDSGGWSGSASMIGSDRTILSMPIGFCLPVPARG